MIAPNHFLSVLEQQNIRFFTGVPDSLLKEICACITDTANQNSHIIAANEGAAVALATGYHLSTGRVPLVYLQNSGLGNTINPLLSLADPEVYSIPMLLMVGWRGEPGVKDEPQHIKQGRVQNNLLEAMEIPYLVLSADSEDYQRQLTDLLGLCRQRSCPVALIIRKGTFAPYLATRQPEPELSDISREAAIEAVLSSIDPSDVVVSTTGMPSREVFESRANRIEGHHRDFLTVGSMGHACQIALGIALHSPDRNVYCIDGDGALIMHMGSMAINGASAPANFRHIVLNNAAHDSVGGQPTVAGRMDIPGVATSSGYKGARRVSTSDELKNGLAWVTSQHGPVLLEIWVRRGSRKDLGRPTRTPQQNKADFMDFLADPSQDAAESTIND
jgi:phosphonopyruvate decarboxylase